MQTEWLFKIAHTIEGGQLSHMDYLEWVVKLAGIFLSVVTGVCAIKGLSYIRTLREKKLSAIFSYWIHIETRLMMLSSRLQSDNSIINNIYASQIRERWDTQGLAANMETVKEFKILAIETLEYMKNCSDQIPAYDGWTDDYMYLFGFLNDVIQYDIEAGDEKYKFRTICGIEERDKYCRKAIDTMEKMVEGIKKKQRIAEKTL